MACTIQLSNFSYIRRGNANWGRALRFTVAFSIEFQNGTVGEIAIDGCLAFYRKIDRAIVWSPPLTQYGHISSSRYQSHWLNPTLYNIVLDELKEHPKLLEPLKGTVDKMISAIPLDEYNENLPKLLEQKL